MDYNTGKSIAIFTMVLMTLYMHKQYYRLTKK